MTNVTPTIVQRLGRVVAGSKEALVVRDVLRDRCPVVVRTARWATSDLYAVLLLLCVAARVTPAVLML
eukprot:11078610-Prorocentrum_lima.AAC.1